jgi:hypothetical protein
MKYLLITCLIFISIESFAKTNYLRKKKTKISSQTCEKAFKAAKASASKSILFEADNICEKAAAAACVSKVENESDGPNTGDGQWVAASCELSIAYGGNKAVNNGVATSGCEKASKKAYGSVTVSDLYEASDLCKKEQDVACEEIVNKTSDGPNSGDGELVSASCHLIASHGSYSEVTKKVKLNSNFNSKRSGPASTVAR